MRPLLQMRSVGRAVGTVALPPSSRYLHVPQHANDTSGGTVKDTNQTRHCDDHSYGTGAQGPASTKRSACPLYKRTMGSSTCFRYERSPVTRETITALEKERLGHVLPSRINDHVCIGMVKVLRWIADRLFRERYIHRATMLATVAPAAPTAASVVAFILMSWRRDCDAGPFVRRDGASNAPDELRGLLSQAECYGIHLQMLLNMTNIYSSERVLLLVLQSIHFSIFCVLFLVYPRMAFRLMGYLAEESSVVWTQMVNDIDLGKIAERPVPRVALTYWNLQSHFQIQGRRPESPERLHQPMPQRQRDDTFVDTPPVFSQGDVKQRSVGVWEGKASSPSVTSSQSTVLPEPRTGVSSSTAEDVDSGQNAPSDTRLLGSELDTSRGSELETLTLRDVVLLIRSDVMTYRNLNHVTADLLDSSAHDGDRLSQRFLKQVQHRMGDDDKRA